MSQQLLMFPDRKQDDLERKMEILQVKYDNLRKGQYASIAETKKIALEARNEIEFLKSMICKNQGGYWHL